MKLKRLPPYEFLYFSLAFFISFLSAQITRAEDFPFLGEINSDRVNIRAGQHMNFEKVCRLSKGAQVVVVEKSYSWCKIKLPAESNSFISRDYVQLLDDKTGLVTGNRVNIRAGQNSNSSSLGQAKKGTTVKILEKFPGWYKIEPVEGTYGWVSEQYITFKSNQVPAAVPAVISPSKDSQEKINQNQAPLPPAPVSEIEEKGVTQTVITALHPQQISVSGKVEALEESIASGDIRHKLIADNQKIYYLKGYKKVVDDFVSFQVTVEGHIQPDPKQLYPYPVLEISRINLIL